MNDFSDIENELKKLRPAAPSADLVSRIEVALAQPEPATPSAGVLPKPSRFRINWYSVGLGLAAAATFVILTRANVDQPQPRTKSQATNATPVPSTSFADAFVPADTTRVVYETRDEGLHYVNNDSAPVRRLRSRARETMQWQNPKTGASLQVSYPAEEVTLVPVSGQ